jgi:hypothetical protein
VALVVSGPKTLRLKFQVQYADGVSSTTTRLDDVKVTSGAVGSYHKSFEEYQK